MTDPTFVAGIRRYIWGPSVHTIRIELLWVAPVVWRRFVVVGFDPDAFDQMAVTKRLRRVR